MPTRAPLVLALTFVPAALSVGATFAGWPWAAGLAAGAAAIGGGVCAFAIARAEGWRTEVGPPAETRGTGLDETRRLTKAQRRLFDNIPDPLLHVGVGKIVLAANRSAETLFGTGLEDRYLSEVLRHPEVHEAADAVLAGEPGREVQIELAESSERHFSVRIEPLQPAGALVLLHDTTQLAKLERMRADFVANASHELRTPLASLVGFIETLLGPAKDDAQARATFLGIMNDQARRMTRLVDDLLSLSRIELREHTPPKAAVDLPLVLRTLKTTLDRQAETRGMPIVLELQEDLPMVAGDADELTQVFQNLIDNALKYGKPGTDVVVSVGLAARVPPSFPDPRRAAVAVAVTDHGEGIARAHLSRLTERFYRVDVARSRDMGGTGLGLAIVKHIVNHHRGALVVDSELGRGSTFTIYLPVVG
jgi:two-component system phosphate regulon sensor histidine kinase PhoR